VEVLARGLAVFFDPSPPSPLPSKGRGGIEADFRPDEENFNAIGRLGLLIRSFVLPVDVLLEGESR